MKKIVFYLISLLGVLQIVQSLYFIAAGCDAILCVIWMIMGLLFVLLCCCLAQEKDKL